MPIVTQPSRAGGGMLPTSSPYIRYGKKRKNKLDALASLAKRYDELRKAPLPALAEGASRRADALIGAAGQAGDQGKAEFLAGGGGRLAGAPLFAGQIKQMGMVDAAHEAAAIRQAGAQAQADAMRAREADIQGLLALMENIRAEREARRMARMQQDRKRMIGGVQFGPSARSNETTDRWRDEWARRNRDFMNRDFWGNPRGGRDSDAAGGGESDRSR